MAGAVAGAADGCAGTGGVCVAGGFAGYHAPAGADAVDCPDHYCGLAGKQHGPVSADRAGAAGDGGCLSEAGGTGHAAGRGAEAGFHAVGAGGHLAIRRPLRGKVWLSRCQSGAAGRCPGRGAGGTAGAVHPGSPDGRGQDGSGPHGRRNSGLKAEAERAGVFSAIPGDDERHVRPHDAVDPQLYRPGTVMA